MAQALHNNPYSRLENAQLPLPEVLITLDTVTMERGFYETFANSPHTELTYVIPRSGMRQPAKGRFDIDDSRLQVADLGPLVLRPCGVPLHAFAEGNEKSIAQILMCQFDDEYFSNVTGLQEWNPKELIRCNNLQLRTVALFMRRIAEELAMPQFGAAMAIESLVQLILVEIAREFRPKLTDSLPINRRLAPWQLRKIEEHLRETTDRWPSLGELAQLCGISSKHLSRVFSTTTGMPIKKFSEQIRIERAKAMLSESRLAIKQVAATLGFPNANYFSTAFHRATGETASAFAKRY